MKKEKTLKNVRSYYTFRREALFHHSFLHQKLWLEIGFEVIHICHLSRVAHGFPASADKSFQQKILQKTQKLSKRPSGDFNLHIENQNFTVLSSRVFVATKRETWEATLVG